MDHRRYTKQRNTRRYLVFRGRLALDAETVAPFDSTWEPFWNLSSQSILYDRYRKWRSCPQDDAKFDAADEAAGNPHLAYFKEGYMKLVEMVADEVLDHEALDDVFLDPKTVARAAYRIVTSLPRPSPPSSLWRIITSSKGPR